MPRRAGGVYGARLGQKGHDEEMDSTQNEPTAAEDGRMDMPRAPHTEDGYVNPPLVPLPEPKRLSSATLTSSSDADAGAENELARGGRKGNALALSFVLMVIVGLGNKLFQIFQTGPMHNYPFFLNFLSTFIYVPVSFMYIIPMQMYGRAITKEQTQIPKRLFAVMGILDGAAGLMQGFATNYITKRPMIILLQQAAIPSSMLISKLLLRAKYKISQYLGALVVFCGIVVVILPGFLTSGDSPSVLSPTPSAHYFTASVSISPHSSHAFLHSISYSTQNASTSPSSSQTPTSQPSSAGSQIVWILVMLLSCVPMCLSSVFKEKALGEVEIDVVYLNGWVAVFQLLFTIVMAVPAAYTSGLTAEDVPANFFGGLKCYAGINSNSPGPNGTTYIDSLHGGPHQCQLKDFSASMTDTEIPQCDDCSSSTIFVSVYLLFNIGYNLLIILILKFGSSNVLWLAMTVMVPLGNAAFYIPGIPGHTNPSPFDLAGLILIMLGLCSYRFAAKCSNACCMSDKDQRENVDGLLQASQSLGRSDRLGSERSRGMSRTTSFFENDLDEQVGLVVARNRVGINGIEVLQAVMQDAAKRHPAIRPDLVRSPEQIRFGFLRRLGVNAIDDRQLERPFLQGRRVGRVSSQDAIKRFY